MGVDSGEYEVVEHGDLADIKVFLVRLFWRNPHFHREFELCRVVSGSVRVTVQQESRDFRSGDLFLFNPHLVHEIHAIGPESAESGAEILSLQVSPRWCERFFPAMAYVEFDSFDFLPALDAASATSLRAGLDALATDYFAQGPSYEFACVSRVASNFYLLMTRVSRHTLSEKERAARIARSDRVNRITEYAESRFTEKLLLSDIARREGLTLAYLSHFFRDNFGMSFQRFVALLRFDEARRLIERTDLPVTDVSLTCGFSDYRYLNKIYEEKVGLTPAEWRKRNRVSSGGMPAQMMSGSIDTDGRESRHSKQEFYSSAKSLAVLSRVSSGTRTRGN
jgi:AraC-like DNA-binding protein